MGLSKRNVDCMSHWGVCGVIGLGEEGNVFVCLLPGMAVAPLDCWVALCALCMLRNCSRAERGWDGDGEESGRELTIPGFLSSSESCNLEAFGGATGSRWLSK